MVIGGAQAGLGLAQEHQGVRHLVRLQAQQLDGANGQRQVVAQQVDDLACGKGDTFEASACLGGLGEGRRKLRLLVQQRLLPGVLLGEAVVQTGDALGGGQARLELLGVERLGQVVVSSGLHAFQEVAATAQH
jgi:hypothetical protein